ncbi:MAG: hypothetical protein WCR21_09210, partial [Bacteroidota bacterium]
MIFFLLFQKQLMNAQSGCTDPQAINYDPLAIGNNGSCTYDVTTLQTTFKGPLFSFAGESSGLYYENGIVWTHNDSGNASDFFKVDTASGTLLQKFSVTNFPNIDWEDITADSAYIYIGECGNNNGTRTDLKILKIDRSQFTSTAAVVGVTAQAINFVYADQTSYASNSSNNFDCEAILSLNGSIYLFTKNRGDFQTRVYRLPKTPGSYTVSPYTNYNVNGKITGADYNRQKKEVVLIGYMASNKNSFLYFLNDFNGDLFFSGNKRRIEIGNAVNDWQTEGVTYGVNANEIFISCETSYTTASLYNANKSNMIPLSITNQSINSNLLKIYPNPANQFLNVSSDSRLFEVELL